MYRVVLDPVVMLRGLLNRASPCRYLLSDYADHYRAIFSNETVGAIRVLLAHPLLTVAFPPLSGLNVSSLAQTFLCAERVQLPRDPGDSVFVAVARVAQADFLVCEDRRLLARRDCLGVPVIQTCPFLALLDPDRFRAYSDDTQEATSSERMAD